MPPSVIYLFLFLHTGTAFMVIMQFRGRLVQQYRACVVDSLGLVLYLCTRHPAVKMQLEKVRILSLDFYAIPIFPFTCLLSF